MKYFNKRNNKVASLISENSKFKTALLEYQDGSTVSVSQSTLKRWWKKMDDEEAYVAEVMEQKRELGIECPKIESITIVSEHPALEDETRAGDGTPYSQVAKEIVADAKAKARKAKEEKLVPIPGGNLDPEDGRERGRKQSIAKERKPSKKKTSLEEIYAKRGRLQKLCESLGFKPRVFEEVNRARGIDIVDNSGHTVGCIYVGDSKFVVLMPMKAVPKGFIPTKVRNCPYGAAFHFDYGISDDFVADLLENVVYIPKKSKKEEK